MSMSSRKCLVMHLKRLDFTCWRTTLIPTRHGCPAMPSTWSAMASSKRMSIPFGFLGVWWPELASSRHPSCGYDPDLKSAVIQKKGSWICCFRPCRCMYWQASVAMNTRTSSSLVGQSLNRWMEWMSRLSGSIASVLSFAMPNINRVSLHSQCDLLFLLMINALLWNYRLNYNWGKLCGLNEAIQFFYMRRAHCSQSLMCYPHLPFPSYRMHMSIGATLKGEFDCHAGCCPCSWLMHYYGITVWTHLRIFMRLLWSNHLSCLSGFRIGDLVLTLLLFYDDRGWSDYMQSELVRKMCVVFTTQNLLSATRYRRSDGGKHMIRLHCFRGANTKYCSIPCIATVRSSSSWSFIT